jgi:two-component system, NarL family, response regulator DevR
MVQSNPEPPKVIHCMIAQHPSASRTLDIAGDPGIREAIEHLIAAEATLERLGTGSLRELRDVTVGELMDAVQSDAGRRPRPQYLQPLPGEPTRSDLHARLSERELEVVRLIVEGLSNKKISDRLSLSDKTVKNHISHILAKLGLTARTQVAVIALRAGIV